MAEVKVKEVTVNASIGGKIQIVQFQYTADYHYSMSQKYDVSDMTEQEAEEFRIGKTKELRSSLEPIAQEEQNKLMDLRDELREES